MNFTIEEVCGTRLTTERLGEYLAQHGICAPDDYIEFLLTYNVAVAGDDAYFFISEDEGDSRVDVFFGVIDDTNFDLAFFHNALKGRIPASWVPIATDAFGNMICMVMWGDEEGSIYFTDHEREDEFPDNAFKLASSFTEFIEETIRPSTDDLPPAASSKDSN